MELFCILSKFRGFFSLRDSDRIMFPFLAFISSLHNVSVSEQFDTERKRDLLRKLKLNKGLSFVDTISSVALFVIFYMLKIKGSLLLHSLVIPKSLESQILGVLSSETEPGRVRLCLTSVKPAEDKKRFQSGNISLRYFQSARREIETFERVLNHDLIRGRTAELQSREVQE